MTASIPGDYAPAPDAFAGRVVLVTGAGGGLGRCVALGAALRGAEVVLLGRTVRTLEATCDRIVAEGGAPPVLCPMDLLGATPEDYEELAHRIDRELGSLHGIVHAAADFSGLAPLAHIVPGDWLRTVHVNLTAPYLLTAACLPLLQAVSDATVVFVGDAPCRRAPAFWGAYAVSKVGLEGLANVLAEEVESAGTPRVVYLSLGPMRTGLRRHAFPAEPPDSVPEPGMLAGGILYALDPTAPIPHGTSTTIE